MCLLIAFKIKRYLEPWQNKVYYTEAYWGNILSKPYVFICELTQTLLDLPCRRKKMRTFLRVRKERKEKMHLISAILKHPISLACISTIICYISKPRLKRVETRLLQTMICFVAHCCVYIVKPLPRTVLECGWMPSLCSQGSGKL